MGAREPAVNAVALFLCTTVPLPRISPGLYIIVLTGLLLKTAMGALTTRYSSADVGVKEPAMLLTLVAVNVSPVAWFAGVVQGGKPAIVVELSVSGAAVKYLGPPVQAIFTENTKK